MNAQNANESIKITKETKNKIRVDFERTPLLERMKARFLSMFFLKKVVWYIARLVLLLGISFVILFPFFAKISGSFMSSDDFVDVTVRLIPKYPTLATYKAIIGELGYWQAFINTFILSGSTSLIQMFICCMVGYGFAKFKFKGNKILFLCVVLMMVVPHDTLRLSLFMKFRFFDILWVNKFLGGILKILPFDSLTLTNTYWPLIIMSIGAIAAKNGLFIFMLRQFFRGVPDELEESAYVDGSGIIRTFVQIILPLSIPMMITVFVLAFSWQWTDDFYTTLFFTTTKTKLMPSVINIPQSLTINYPGQTLFYSAIRNTCGLLIIMPLVILYLFLQKYLIQGIERSGIVG